MGLPQRRSYHQSVGNHSKDKDSKDTDKGNKDTRHRSSSNSIHRRMDSYCSKAAHIHKSAVSWSLPCMNGSSTRPAVDRMDMASTSREREVDNLGVEEFLQTDNSLRRSVAQAPLLLIQHILHFVNSWPQPLLSACQLSRATARANFATNNLRARAVPATNGGRNAQRMRGKTRSDKNCRPRAQGLLNVF